MAETIVQCGGTPAPRRSARTLHLFRTGPRANVDLRVEGIERRMVTSLPGVLADLLDVAAYVYAADQLVSRGGPAARGLGSDWRRDFRFIIPVREPGRWSSPEVRDSLERLLGFMSDDNMRFEFVGSRDPPPLDSYFNLGDDQKEEQAADDVLLFSGGLDSLAGAVERLSSQTSRLLLVSHQSSTKIAKRQRDLATELALRFSNRVLHVPVRANLIGIEATESTQRTRSFLFGALAAVVARITGSDHVRLFENGIVSLNLPIATQVVGTAATRTTHPRVVRDLSDFLSTLLDQDMAVDNAFLWKTKTEVAGLLRESGHADLARHTVSCSRVHWMTRLHTHCGRCSQCLDRRFGALAAGLGEDDPAAMYETDLLTGARDDGLDRTMAESFVRHALELQDLSERDLMTRFGLAVSRAVSCVPGMSGVEIARAILELHRRHADSVRSVLEGGFRRHASDLASQKLPATCILRLVAGPGGIVLPAARQEDEPERPSPDVRDLERSSQIRLALDPTTHQVLIDGMPPLEGGANFVLVEMLANACESDRQKHLAPENHTFLAAGDLAKRLGMVEASLRRCIYRVRRRIADAFETHAGIPLSAHALIENQPWKGYRLNPHVLILAPSELAASPARHEPGPTASQVGGRSLDETMA